MTIKTFLRLTLLLAAFECFLAAQNPTGTLEGQASDKKGGMIGGAVVTVKNLETGYTQTQNTGMNGFFRVTLLPVGSYSLGIQAPNFARFIQEPIEIAVSETARVDVQLELATVTESVTITSDAAQVDTATNALGKVVNGREVLDLPLNGRNFTQLGLLQTGVAPLTAGVLTIGGTVRAGQAYSVNGQRPESNNYLLDGAENDNRVDGGYALKIPVDAIAEFRILTHTAPPEYGGYTGSTTSVVTKAGGNDLHGTLYEFFRNNALDTRNFFSKNVEPLHQNQFGATVGGPIRKNRLFFFGYYEGFRNGQGFTQSAAVPTVAERAGDFSGLPSPLLNFAAGGVPVPGGKISPAAFNPIALNIMNLYPLPNASPSIYSATVVAQNNFDQAGGRIDFNESEHDQFFGRYSFSKGYNINPISVRGAPLPGFPTRDDLTANTAVLSNTHMFSPSMANAARVSFFRYVFDFDERLNQTPPSAFGFDYQSASALGQGPPFVNVSGYSPIGGAQSGPRASTQNTYEAGDGFSWFHGAHSIQFGGTFRRNQINVFQATVPNGLFIFSPAFPTSDAFANLLLGAPVVFYQGLGNFYRGLRNWGTALYAQDEWRATRRLTVNYGLRWEAINPNSEIHNRLDGFVPGVQSHVMPNAPTGILFPGDPGVGAGIAHNYYKAFMPRVGLAWDPTGRGVWSIRTGYGIFYDPFSNGANIAATYPVSALPWVQFDQFTGKINFANPYVGHATPQPNTFAHPSTLLAMDPAARPPYAQDWNFSVQRALHKDYVLEVRYVGTKGTRLPRSVEDDPAVYGPGATAANADRRRIYANCQPNGGPCQLATAAVLDYGTNSTYHAAQVTFSHRYAAGFSFNVSYWYSKSLDYLSGMNLNLSSAQALTGANDLAQNPFDLNAEHGLSTFDATHRFVASAIWEIPFGRSTTGAARVLLHGWQLNSVATANSGTPFTVYDSANVALQASSPPISGYFASRPDLIGDPNTGPHTVTQWISRSPFVRLNPITQAGQFGNAGRNIARGPGSSDVDLSLMKNFRVTERTSLQFRAESFNIANHPNFGLPISDLASPNFGRILAAGPARLMQFALKVVF
jgi:hypothetical protein